MYKNKKFIIPFKDITKYKEFWIHRLGLDKWEIWVYYVDNFGGQKGTTGHCSWSYYDASVHIISPEGMQAADLSTEVDMEVVLVHELLHCVFAPMHPGTMETDTAEGYAQEQILEQLARSLVETRRKGGEQIIERKENKNKENQTR